VFNAEQGHDFMQNIQDDPVQLTTTEARAGRTPHIVRYVLGFSLLLVIVGMVAVLGFGFTLTGVI
jgi:hypothetical protein